MSTLVCVPIMMQDSASALSDAHAARGAGADLVEFRIDEFFDGGHGDADPGHQAREVLRVVAESPLPCIVTCRDTSEGGQYEGEETDRVSLYERLGTAAGKGEVAPRYLDFEAACYTRSENVRQKINLAVRHEGQLRELSTSLILSMHDFEGRPADLSRRLLAAREQRAAAVLKLAYRARSLRDNLELFELLATRDRPMIALGMGEFGLMSRVLAPKFGGFLTFASLRASTVTAPGQPTVAELLDLYRFRSIGPLTKVFGVVGWPVGHSLSPLVHNAAFGRAGFDGVYLPLPIPAGDDPEATYTNFKATLGELIEDPRLDFYGCSVTLPHKENLVRFAGERGFALDAASRAIGAGNTLSLVREHGRGGTVCTGGSVSNTDVLAAVRPLERAIGSLEGRSAAVIGAGGVARAAAYGLASRGARVTVFNRTRERADRLAGDVRPHVVGSVVAEDWSGLEHFAGEVFVQCTPMGMKGGPAPTAAAFSPERMRRSGALRSNAVICETVYTPIRTPLLVEAEAVGVKTVDGVGMFAGQAAEQSKGWTGVETDSAFFEGLVRRALAVP